MVHESHVRAQVAESWFRSAAAGVQADTVDAPITLPGDALRDHREAHPLAQVFPLLDDVLGQAARDCDAIMAVSDAAGQLLWVCGSPSVLRKAGRSVSSRAATGTSGWPAPMRPAWRWPWISP